MVDQQLVVTVLWLLAGLWLGSQLLQIARALRAEKTAGQKSGKTGIIMVLNQEQVIEGVGRHMQSLYHTYPNLNLHLIFLDLGSSDQTKAILCRLAPSGDLDIDSAIDPAIDSVSPSRWQVLSRPPGEVECTINNINNLGQELTVSQLLLQPRDGRQACAQLEAIFKERRR